jgi:hypothetical protein
MLGIASRVLEIAVTDTVFHEPSAERLMLAWLGDAEEAKGFGIGMLSRLRFLIKHNCQPKAVDIFLKVRVRRRRSRK